MFPKSKRRPKWRVTIEALDRTGKSVTTTRDYACATAENARAAAEMLKMATRVIKVESLRSEELHESHKPSRSE